MRYSRTQRSGASALETALVLPVLLILLSGITDFGWFFAQNLRVNHSVRQAARSAAGTDYDLGPEDYGQAELEAQLASFDLPYSEATTASVVVDETTGLVTVTYLADYNPILGLLVSAGRVNLAAGMTLAMEDLSP
ncbi:MAG: Flp pilus assembly protein TadG [Cognaticolwellia sp.]|jgi:Flp pilus assembly protein TadG